MKIHLLSADALHRMIQGSITACLRLAAILRTRGKQGSLQLFVSLIGEM